MVMCESRSSTIGHITLGTKQTGAPSAGNPHAGCDAAGAGNGFTVWLLRHSQRKRGVTARPDLRNTAPVLDPTGMATAISQSRPAPIAVAIGVYRYPRSAESFEGVLLARLPFQVRKRIIDPGHESY
jgi:hypothetical protein